MGGKPLSDDLSENINKKNRHIATHKTAKTLFYSIQLSLIFLNGASGKTTAKFYRKNAQTQNFRR